MRLIAKVIQIEPELFYSHRNDDLDINPVIISGLLLDVCRYRKGSLHNLNPKCRNRSRKFNDAPLVFGSGLILSLASSSKYRSETSSALCLKIEIFGNVLRVHLAAPGEPLFQENRPRHESAVAEDSPAFGRRGSDNQVWVDILRNG